MIILILNSNSFTITTYVRMRNRTVLQYKNKFVICGNVLSAEDIAVLNLEFRSVHIT